MDFFVKLLKSYLACSFTGNWDMLLITVHFHIFVDGNFCNLALLFCDPHSSGLYSSTSIRKNVFNLTWCCLSINLPFLQCFKLITCCPKHFNVEGIQESSRIIRETHGCHKGGNSRNYGSHSIIWHGNQWFDHGTQWSWVCSPQILNSVVYLATNVICCKEQYTRLIRYVLQAGYHPRCEKFH